MGEEPLAPTVYCRKDDKEIPVWCCLGSPTQGRECCPYLARAVISYGKTAEVECKWKEDLDDNPTRT